VEPTRDDPHAVVELLDVLLREGVVLQADVVISVADVPLVGLSLRAAVAGMATMTEHGLLTEFDDAEPLVEPDADSGSLVARDAASRSR
jgi:hypothetical protein